MARIRSVKPEFWTDPAVVALPMAARLLFIGCWNHADDYGVLKDDPGRLKLQVLPSDDVDAAELVDLLVEAALLLRRVAPDGTKVLVVRTFCEHQRIDKRAAGRWGPPEEFSEPPDDTPTSAQSPQIPATPADSPPRTGRDWTGTEETPTPPSDSPPPRLAAVPDAASPPATDAVRIVFDAWIESTGRTDRTVLDAKRRRTIANALKSYPLDDVLDAVRGWRHSPHHRGENDRRMVYNELDVLLRNAGQIEKFRDLERRGSSSAPSVSQAFEQVVQALQRGKRPTFDEHTETVISRLGGWTQLRSSNVDVLRGHFMKFWQAS
jgi:hypothetical protein